VCIFAAHSAIYLGLLAITRGLGTSLGSSFFGLMFAGGGLVEELELEDAGIEVFAFTLEFEFEFLFAAT